jgi:hypothetical protein
LERWAREDTGKSGAYRIIYFFHSMEIPANTFKIKRKNEKVNVSQAERNELKQLAGLLVKQYHKARSYYGREKNN